MSPEPFLTYSGGRVGRDQSWLELLSTIRTYSVPKDASSPFLHLESRPFIVQGTRLGVTVVSRVSAVQPVGGFLTFPLDDQPSDLTGLSLPEETLESAPCQLSQHKFQLQRLKVALDTYEPSTQLSPNWGEAGLYSLGVGVLSLFLCSAGGATLIPGAILAGAAASTTGGSLLLKQVGKDYSHLALQQALNNFLAIFDFEKGQGKRSIKDNS